MMSEKESFLKGKHILAVDDEEDILETITEILDTSTVDTARDYQSASQKIKERKYDLAILDIMGVDGLQLLAETVHREIPTVMLTAHAVNPDTLMSSIRKGAISYLPKETLARISFQRFFRLYGKLAGMTGTAAEIRNELWQIYSLPVVVIPPRRACKRTTRPDRIFSNEDAKWKAVVAEIRSTHEAGRPVLVGTRSVAASESLSRRLTAENLDHEVLNAVRHDAEARIIAEAGRSATKVTHKDAQYKVAPFGNRTDRRSVDACSLQAKSRIINAGYVHDRRSRC